MLDYRLDIQWLEHMNEGLERARALRRPVVLKPLGQGRGCFEQW